MRNIFDIFLIIFSFVLSLSSLKIFLGNQLFFLPTFDIVDSSSLALTLLTAGLVYYTMVLAKEARITRQQSLEPNIVVTIEPYEKAVFHAFLIIENIGKAAGYDVEIKENKNLTFNDDRKEFILNDLAFMHLKILKPKQKIEHYLGTFEKLPSKTFEFDITAKSLDGRLIKNSNNVDVNCYYDRRTFHGKDIEDLVNSFKRFEENFGHVVSGFRKVNVNVVTKEKKKEKK